MKLHVPIVRRILSLALCLLMVLSVAPTASAATGSKVYQPNPDFGTYKGMRADGVFEFDLTLPAKSQEDYPAYPLLTGYPKIASFHSTQEVKDKSIANFINIYLHGSKPGTTTAEYKVWRDGELPQLKVVVYITVVPEEEYDPSVNRGFEFVQPPELDPDSSGTSEKPDTPGNPTDETCQHIWKTTNTPATCTEQGHTARTCSKCGETEVLSTTPALKHSYTATVTVPATAKKEGVMTYTCSRCQNTYTETIPKLDNSGENQPNATESTKPEQPTASDTPSSSTSFGNGASVSDRGRTISCRSNGNYEMVWVNGYKVLGEGNKVVSDNRKLKITTYSPEFKELSVKEIPIEMEDMGGVYFGKNYNFLVFGQVNWEESNSKEVLRIVKYSKDWNRLGAASIRDIFTTDALKQHGNLSYAEAGDMLYLHLGRSTYTCDDGNQHQTNMTLCIRQSDMALTDSIHEISNNRTGYVSHAMQQDILVDQIGNLITLDNGDGFPRGAMLFKYGTQAGGDKFTGRPGTPVILREWPGSSDIQVGATTNALAETSQGYLSAVIDSGRGGSYNFEKDPTTAYLIFTPKSNFSAEASQTRIVAVGTAVVKPTFMYLIPINSEGGYVMWYTTDNSKSGDDRYTLYYTTYAADGSIGTAKLLSNVPMPYEGPIYTDGKLVWGGSTEDPEGLRFCVMDSSGQISVHKVTGELAGEGSDSNFTASGSNPFTDVPTGAYYTDAVLWAYQNNITKGTTATSFEPYTTCTRGQVVTFLWRAMGEPEPKTTVNPFRDVKASDYYYNAVLWAYENRITSGTTASTFSPSDTCTNGHVITFLWRANGEPEAASTSSLAKRFPNAYYTPAVAWADTTGLLADTGAEFNPDNMSPRANIVTYLYRNLTK